MHDDREQKVSLAIDKKKYLRWQPCVFNVATRFEVAFQLKQQILLLSNTRPKKWRAGKKHSWPQARKGSYRTPSWPRPCISSPGS